MGIGRNEPCPCGSGKKYKHCCLANAAEATAMPDALTAQHKAHEWLRARFGKTRRADIENDYFELVEDLWQPSDETDNDWDDPIRSFLHELDDGDRHTLDVALNDWALNEAKYERHDHTARGIDWVLHANDLRLSPPQRTFLEALANSSAHVYEVIAVERDRGLHLRDVLQPDRSAVFVHEISATYAAEPGMLIGARLVDLAGHAELGGMICVLSPVAVLEMLDELAWLLEAGEVEPARIPLWLIRDAWLIDYLHAPMVRALPLSRPAYFEDRYDVIDADALHAAFDACTDLRSSGVRSALWLRTSDDPPTLHIVQHPTSDGGEVDTSVMKMPSPSEAAADAARTWLENLTCDSVSYRERTHVEPAPEDHFDLPLSLDGDTPSASTAERRNRLAARYAAWRETPLDILGAKRPQDMLATAADRYRVELLLRVYDDVEEALARSEGRESVSFDFLRRQLDEHER